MSLFSRKVSKKISNKVMEEVDQSKNKKVIYFVVYIAMIIIFGYTAIYQFTDGQGLNTTKIVGAVICGLLALIGVFGLIGSLKNKSGK